MNFKEVRYSTLQLAWMYQRMKADEIDQRLPRWSIWYLLLMIALPIGTVVMAIRRGEELEQRHDAIVGHVERYWAAKESK